jgi:membrane associated rhomboid family serine protease
MSKCECGQPLALDAMKCPKCGKKFTIEPRFTGFEIPEPPIDQWREELSAKREYTEESLAEVKREAELRQKKKNKRSAFNKRSGTKSGADKRSGAKSSANKSPGTKSGFKLSSLFKRNKTRSKRRDYTPSFSRSASTNWPALILTAIALVYGVRLIDQNWLYFTDNKGYLSIGLVGLTSLISICAFINRNFFESWLFKVGEISQGRQYWRLITSGFLHVDFFHLLFNMYALFSFGVVAEEIFSDSFGYSGPATFVVFYLAAIFFSDLPSLVMQRKNLHYSSAGASGAISALLAFVVIVRPDQQLYLNVAPGLGTPVEGTAVAISGVLYLAIYLAVSVIFTFRKNSRINHLAHFAGAIFGLLVGLVVANS